MTPSQSLPAMARPLMVSFTLRFLFSLVDLIFAALIAKADNAPVAAIGLFAPLQFVFIAIWVGLSAGFTAGLSQAFGSQDEARVTDLKHTMLRVLRVVAPAMACLGVGLWFVIPGLGLEPRLEAAFRTYATTLFIGMPLTGFWSIYPDSIIKAHQQTRITMVAGLMSSVTNVLLNTLFALVLHMGLFGIALATVISRIPSLAYASWRAHVLEKGRLHERWEPVPTQWRPPLTAILTLAVPGAVAFLLAAVENGIVNRALKDLPSSTTAIATYGVYDRLLNFALMPASATAVAVVPFVARLLPSGAITRIRADLRRGVGLAAVISIVITVLVGWVFADPVTSFLIKTKPGAVQQPIALDVIHLLPLGVLAIVPFQVLRPVFEAANLPKLGSGVSMLRYLALSIPIVLFTWWLSGKVDANPLLVIVVGLITASALASGLVVKLARQTLAERRMGSLIPTEQGADRDEGAAEQEDARDEHDYEAGCEPVRERD